jgi:hypothetical protein
MPHKVTVDPQTEGGLNVTDLLARKIDEGLAFSATHTVTVGTGTAVSVLIVTPATGTYHLVAECECKKAGTFTLQEAPNTTVGTAVTGVNLNRQSTKTDTLSLTHTQTLTSAGTVLENHVIGGISGPTARTRSYLLNVSTRYIARFTADATTSETVINLFYYREE